MEHAESERDPQEGKTAQPLIGRRIPLSLPRRVMGDLLSFAKAIPSVPVQRRMNVAFVLAARSRAASLPDVPGWCAIFTKAYAITASRIPELRRAYLAFPFASLYEHPFSIASIAFERDYKGDKAVFWGHLRRPEGQSLRDLQAHIRHYKDSPVESIRLFRRPLQVARLPLPLRRFLWWVGLNYSGAKRASRFGTFGVSVYSGLGAESLHPISPLTGTLNYGTIEPDGTVSVRLVYDHRVIDGANVARALALMENVLNGEIAEEIQRDYCSRAA
jgi:hypothetical protein